MKKPSAGRPTSPGPKPKPFSIRLSSEVRAALSKAGEAEDRPAAYVALRYITEGLRSAGFLK